MNEDPQCRLCELCSTAGPRSRCLKGSGSMDAALLIYLDAPTMVEDKRSRSFVSEGADYLRHLLDLMSVDKSQVYVDYVLKCYPKPNKNFGKKAPRGCDDRSLFCLQSCNVATIETEDYCSNGVCSMRSVHW